MIKCDDLAVIEELIGDGIANAVSPGFPFDRNGNVGGGTWLLSGSNISNRTGMPFGLANGVMLRIWVGNQDISTFTAEVYEHEGDSINLTLLTSVGITAARSGFFDVGDFGIVNVTQNRQLAVKISAGSCKEPKVILFLGGTN